MFRSSRGRVHRRVYGFRLGLPIIDMDGIFYELDLSFNDHHSLIDSDIKPEGINGEMNQV